MKKHPAKDDRFAWLLEHGEPGVKLRRLLIAMEDFQRSYDRIRIAVRDVEYFHSAEMTEAMKGLTNTQIAILASAAREIQNWQERWNQNAARHRALLSMPYDDYLQTDEWRATAQSARRRAGNRCQVCGRNDVELHVHHNSYERLGREADEDLVVLCADHHALFHGKKTHGTHS